MQAIRLHGAKDLRLDDIPKTPPPGEGQVRLKISSVGVCGSDLHTYKDGRIGDTVVSSPLTLGHEFSGVVTEVGKNASDAHGNPLREGQLVAVDPAVPCWHCEVCEAGHPNLCPNHYFYGLYPDDGALQEEMNVVSRNCFPVPEGMTTAVATLLEPLGVALHALNLARIKLADTVAVLGCGPIGLKVIRLARLAGAQVFAFDLYPWRTKLAMSWGADEAFCLSDGDPVQFLHKATHGRGADVVLEVAWADHSVQQAADMASMGGKLVLVGIPEDDTLTLKHSTARRKGLSILLSRRMKHTYPRAIKLAEKLDLESLVTHRFPLSETPAAYRATAEYEPGLIKTLIELA
jgi:L-iditol 2-dehydrogenase